jgi:hypothetical protein
MKTYFLRILILIAGSLVMGSSWAIDGNYAIPYTDGQNATQTGVNDYGRRSAELPVMSMVGGVLVVLGAAGAVYWQLTAHRRRSTG